MRDLSGYQAKIVCDTTNGVGTRVTTFELQMPKWLVAELNTHRSAPEVTRHLARNSASSRAVPTSRIIAAVTTNPVYPTGWELQEDFIDGLINNPVVPTDWRENTGGMQQDTILSDSTIATLDYLWLRARDSMINYARRMLELKADKQRVNRMLEPWMWTKVVITSTEWDAFFELRNHPAAQPEFGHIAHLMHTEYSSNEPKLAYWHMPYLLNDDDLQDEHINYLRGLKLAGHELVNLNTPVFAYLLISAARCGRVTYYRQGETKDLLDDIQRGLSFANNKHWSPLEHCGRLMNDNKWYGPFFEFKSLRKYFLNESGKGRRR